MQVQPAVWPTLVGHQQAHSTAAAAARAAGAAAESSSRSRRPTSRSAPATADPATTSTSSHNSSSSSSVIQPQRVALSDQTASDAAAGSSARTLMIVESPTKATKIQKFLGSSYKVRFVALVAYHDGISIYTTCRSCCTILIMYVHSRTAVAPAAVV